MAQLLALSMIRKDYSQASGVRDITLLSVLTAINSRKFNLTSGHIPVAKWPSQRAMTVVDIRTEIGCAHTIPTGEGQWIVTNRIDLQRFNEIN